MTIRVAVVGNCTSLGIANAVKALSIDTYVQHFSVTDIHNLDPAQIKSMFEGFDLSLTFSEIGSYSVIQEQTDKIRQSVLWPSIVFSGYHPDIAYFGIEGRVANSCLGSYNSRIVAAAYAHEMTVEETADRFNALTFARLGYFDAYDLWRRQLLATAESHNLDFEADIARWEASGPFMYTINHPKIAVVNDLARQLVEVSGLEINPDVNIEETVPDYFADGIVWPVYPEIADRIGNVQGSYEFKPAGHIRNGTPSMHLEEFIDGCFKQYDADGFTPAQFRKTPLYTMLGPRMGIELRA
ncbi:hypothetical protein HB779_14850 [Phyllobacterium sp. 628]|uniref:WcbI family polysaccharide biosynthesis putative acetyltransferase n=1 Tax=Phyllobacterium sp. 628 TaxID=2718938 RepID=UPI001662424C|nr:WcbI family polysaccharide biosynthesis putative acetyltransferase [Phyllobacterium sp. 628]QND53037.1 hypothetical protein HB779_14850 [Phyllobacterium sp. 628]